MPAMQPHADIIIHGGGLVGNSLALALAKTALNIAIIEPFPASDKQRSILESRTIALSHGTRRIYEAMGVWSLLSPYCTPIKHIHVSDKGRFGMTRIHADEQHMPALGYVLQVAEVNRLLSEKLKDYPTIRTICPAKIAQAHLHNEQWQITLQQQYTTTSMTADLLIAADGGQSPLRDMMGLVADEKDYQQTALVTSVQLSRDHHYTAYERFMAEGPIALLPVQRDIAAVVVTVANTALAKWQALSDAEFLQVLQREFGYRLGRFKQVGARVAYPLKLISTAKQVAPQFVLMGNAAHVLHPIAAQSFNLSLRDAAVLAELISTAVKQNQRITTASLLLEYEQQRHADQQRTVKFTDRLIDIFANPAFSLPRNIAMTGLDMVPPLKTLLGKYGAGTLGKLSRLARGLEI